MSAKKTRATRSAPATPGLTESPRRWLVLEATALLESVAAMNLSSYGRRPAQNGVPGAAREDAELLEIRAELGLIAADGLVRLRLPDLMLTRAQHSERQTVWTGYDAVRRLQVIWAWDFYRIQSHVVLRAGIPEETVEPEALWASAVSALRAAAVRDRIALTAQSAYGDLQQDHILTARAHEWTPGA